MNCEGCENLRVVPWARGKKAFRCFATLPEPWGNGRVVDVQNAAFADPRRIIRPAWCPHNEN